MRVWSDGACSGSPGIGGWAWISDTGRVGYGSAPSTTSQRMELTAVLDVVTHVPGPLDVYSDSAYVVNCFQQGWWKGWRRTNFKNRSIKNLDLWEPLIEAVIDGTRGRVQFTKVKGHSGDPMNDAADRMAVAAKKNQHPITHRKTVVRRSST